MGDSKWWQRLLGSLDGKLPQPRGLPAQDLFPKEDLSPNTLSNQKLGGKDQRLPQVWQALLQNGFTSTQGKGI